MTALAPLSSGNVNRHHRASRVRPRTFGDHDGQGLGDAVVVLIGAGLSLRFVLEGALGMPIAGSMLLFLFGAMLHLFSTTSIGILLATIARSMPQFGLLMIIVILPLQMLSGGYSPRESMPEVVQNIMLAAPTTHFTALAQAICIGAASTSSGPSWRPSWASVWCFSSSRCCGSGLASPLKAERRCGCCPWAPIIWRTR